MKFLRHALCLLSALFVLATTAASAQVNHLVISQVYGGGGNANATYHNDFIEVFNPSTGPISVAGYTIQYASNASITFAVAATLGGTSSVVTVLNPGQYYLINLASGGTPGATNPTSDTGTTGTTNISATQGKIALVNGAAPITSCTAASITDLVLFGTNTGAGCPTTTNAPTPSAILSDTRTNLCTYTGVASTDFATQTPVPHNSTTTITACGATNTNPAASIALSTYPSPTNVGIAHSFTVTAKDSSGNTATSYTGTISFTSTDAAASLPASYTFTAADSGIHTFSAAFNTTGTQSLTVKDITNNFTATQAGILVNATLWIVNNDTTVSQLGQGGNVLTTAGTAAAVATLGGIAVDNAGYAYAVTNSVSNVTQYSPTTGALLYTSTSGGINLPTAITVDGLGYLWIANANNSISRLATSASAAPLAVSPATGYTGGGVLATPSAIVVDTTGSVWVANSTSGTVTRFFGAAAPVPTPLVTAITNGTQGTRP